VPVVRADSAAEALRAALASYGPEVVVDLSDEPVVTAADRFALASLALAAGARYEGADFAFDPPPVGYVTATPTLAVIGTGKRVGKTAVCAYAARTLTAAGKDVAVLAMGRGGPAEPEVIRGDEVRLTVASLLEAARQGRHAASDHYEDAVMSRVTTVGCRRCGGGMAGATAFSNVEEGARLADALGKDLLLLEGSGAAIPPVARDACLLVVGAAQGEGSVRDHFGPFRLGLADAVVVVAPEPLGGSATQAAAVRAAIGAQRPDLPCATVTLRPAPMEPVAGRRVFFVTTARPDVLPVLVAHLEGDCGCEVVAASPHLADRRLLREDLARAAGTFDMLLTELKAAAIDVVAEFGERAGVPVMLCDNALVAVDRGDLEAMIERLADMAIERAEARRRP
jgi:cyclic 2,3-diphosphoglycerate synthetase